MQQIKTHGIHYLEPLAGSNWYYGMDYTGGDLYEAQELFRHGHPIQKNRLILIRHPDGKVIEPVQTNIGQYLGQPVYHDGQVILLLVDFPDEEIHIIGFDPQTEQTASLATLPLSIAQDCYNLLLHTPPLMLTRSPQDNHFQILWPEYREFMIEDHESFACLEGDKLYTTVWYEDPDYREEILVRDFTTGAVLKRMPGTIWAMPGGQNWALV